MGAKANILMRPDVNVLQLITSSFSAFHSLTTSAGSIKNIATYHQYRYYCIISHRRFEYRFYDISYRIGEKLNIGQFSIT